MCKRIKFVLMIVPFLLWNSDSEASLVFDVLTISPAGHPYQERIVYELSGSLVGPAPAVDRDKLYIVSTTPNDTDWIFSSGQAAQSSPVFPGAPPNFVNNFGYSWNPPAHHMVLDYFGPLSVGQSVTSTGPYNARFTFDTIANGNVDGLAIYWGRSGLNASAESGVFQTLDFDLSGPTNFVPEPSGIALFTIALALLIGFRKYPRLNLHSIEASASQKQ